MLVVDASIAVRASHRDGGFAALRDPDLYAPPLMWSEARSALHELAWRGEIATEDAHDALGRLERCPVKATEHRDLAETAWRIGDELGWARLYDAEYLALARLLGCRVVTLDGRLLRAGARLGLVVAPTEG